MTLNKKKLLIAADVDRSLMERASSDSRFDVSLKPVKSEDDLAGIVGDAEILVTRAYNKVSRRVLDRATQLKLIAQGTSGTDNIDESAARERGITILSLPGENANAVAELVIGFMISLTRTIPFYTREVAAGKWPRDDCATRHEMAYFRLGIIGLGQVGRRVSRLAGAFGMRVTAFDPYIEDSDFKDRGAARAPSLDALLAGSDIVTVHVPLSAETRRMLGANEILRLKRGTILINAARGEIVDQNAALAALASNHLSGLALDVYDPEPVDKPLPDDPRLILTPHIAGCSHECKTAIGARLFEKISAFYRGV
jgi:phosphoglycerate dehydrogenase-like enzyme